MFACVCFYTGGVRMRLAVDSEKSDRLLLCVEMYSYKKWMKLCNSVSLPHPKHPPLNTHHPHHLSPDFQNPALLKFRAGSRKFICSFSLMNQREACAQVV